MQASILGGLDVVLCSRRQRDPGEQCFGSMKLWQSETTEVVKWWMERWYDGVGFIRKDFAPERGLTPDPSKSGY